MEVECPRHPGASTVDSQLLDETASMVGKSWPPSYEPLSRRVERPGHTDTIYTVETRGGGGAIKKLCSKAYNRHYTKRTTTNA